MTKDRDPDARPITVDELIARTGEFPKAGSPAVSRAEETPAPDEHRTTASGMPDYTPPVKPTAKAVGASGMPVYTPVGRSADDDSPNAVTGIIPVVGDADDDFGPLDTGGLRAVEPDDLVGVDLPTGEQPIVVAATEETTATDVTTAADVAAPVAGERPAETLPADATTLVDAADVPEVAAADLADDDAEDEGAGRAAVFGWLGLIGEILLGLAVGAGLFWGFTVLWKQYVYFALVLAVLVIFAIVTFAYVLRKRDLPTTLLALAVGLIVTIGPLVLLV
ncbi:hypothetical protein C6V83_17080 [Gordonia iterans]|uniref:Uncharacterized protein n=1 Tax=Gordonia iterans TaxID=1004901 RepID=A0A2S0KKX6_9ACTN|nr:hypothetical protein [Gordonia iterans]AVM02340.1 hypothetical protein C6V83_17080 [Gordonia iterans]